MRAGARSGRRARAWRIGAAVAACAAVMTGAGCGGDDETAATTATSPGSAAQLDGIKGYLLDHTADLTESSAALKATATEYHDLAEASGFDHAAMLQANRAQVAEMVARMKREWRAANPAYEEAEGIVAGVPSLADYDVILDAGASGQGPDAAPWDLRTADGRVLERPGNLFFVTETAIWGTEPKFAAKGVTPDLDGDGRVEFGEAVPDAQVLLAATTEFDTRARELAADAEAWQPTTSDVFTAMVVMTPTMSEYFEAWKNSRAVAGARATESGFVGTSRLSDIVDILEGLQTTYAGIRPAIAEADAAQAAQTGRQLDQLVTFVADVRDREASGATFTAEDADVLGTEAQRRAEAIAGQITQSAAQLDIELQEA